MIDEIFSFIQVELNRGLRGSAGTAPEAPETADGLVLFLGGDVLDPITFPIEKISVLLVNIEHERLMRPADPFRRMGPDGVTPQRIKPDVRIDLSVLFVARFKNYLRALKLLSAVIQFFQEHPTFVQGEYPGLPQGIEKFLIEPVTLSLAAQNEVWTALRATYQPSLLYRIRTLVFEDRQPVEVPISRQTEVHLKKIAMVPET